jgi:hypothetical protein
MKLSTYITKTQLSTADCESSQLDSYTVFIELTCRIGSPQVAITIIHWLNLYGAKPKNMCRLCEDYGGE